MNRTFERVLKSLVAGLPSQNTELLLSRYGYIFYYAAIVYPLFVFLDWHEIPWDRSAALIIRITVSMTMLALATACRTKWGRPHALSLITLGFLLGQAGFTLLVWHAKGLGLSDGDDFSDFFGPFCVLIPAAVSWTAGVGVVMIALTVANYAISGSQIDLVNILWETLPYFVVFLSARHAANVLEFAWKREFVEKTELERTIVELRKTQDILVQAEKMAALGRLTAGVGHELNNPLFVMGTNLSVLEKVFTPDSEEVFTNDFAKSFMPDSNPRARNALQRLRAALVRASFITQILREFSAPPNRRTELVNINDVIRLSISLVTMTTKDKEVNIHAELGNLPPIPGDPQSLVQVLVNLFENAYDAVSLGGNVWVETRVAGIGAVEIQVRDDGPGIPPEDLKKLVEPFFTTKDPGRGMGLGLAVANSVIERHGGTLHFSNGDTGAIATISFPLQPILPD